MKDLFASAPHLSLIPCKHAWSQLDDEEKLYVHYLNQANWSSFPISVIQCSVEAPGIFLALLKMFKTTSHADIMSKAAVSDEAKTQFDNYIAAFLTNGGNYLSFGDRKFIPECSKEDFEKIVRASGVEDLLQFIPIIYDTTPSLLNYGIPPKGCTAYYSPDITEEEINHVNRLLEKKGMLLENTRIDKVDGRLVVGVASVEEKTEEYEDIIIKYGWCKQQLQKVVESLKKCLELELVKKDVNKNNMIESYIDAFTSNYNLHKEAQRWWVRDQKPSVEFNVGFIEVYEDPAGVRGEWEMFVAIVDKEKTKELTELVDHAPEIIESFPWGKEFEKTKFECPDFTSIDIVGFGTSGLPIGINLPNYNDVRMEQFKNVSLSNVMSCGGNKKNLPFLRQEDAEVYSLHRARALEVQVALHELLGHGSGRYLRCDNGVKNFTEGLVNPITGKPVTYYSDAMTFQSVFKSLGSSLEECRAETVGLTLVHHPKVVEILGITPDEQYISWLQLLRQAVVGCKFYNPETKTWGQAHCRARFAILKTLENAGVVKIEGKCVHLERSEVEKGLAALNDLLLKLQVARATADVAYAEEFFVPLTVMDDGDLRLRQLVIEENIQREGYIQCNTVLKGGVVELKEYEASVEGLIESYLDRYELLH